METIIDKDLEFLSGCRNEELKKLCDILTFNKMGLYRISEHLTDTDEYICHYPLEMDQMSGAIANELLCDGTNSIVMAWNSGQPDSYDDVLWRVCKCVKADVSREDSVVAKEHGLLLKLCSDAISQMSISAKAKHAAYWMLEHYPQRLLQESPLDGGHNNRFSQESEPPAEA